MGWLDCNTMLLYIAKHFIIIKGRDGEGTSRSFNVILQLTNYFNVIMAYNQKLQNDSKLALMLLSSIIAKKHTSISSWK